MKKLLLTILICMMAVSSASAQKTFQWGPAEWNIEEGWTFESYEDYNGIGVILTYPNPANYTLTFLNILAVDYLVYKDDVEVPDTASSSVQGSTIVKNMPVRLSYDFLEGHSYKVVTTKAVLVQANLATYKTDTLSMNDDSYQISFSINGPELVKTINVEQYMSLAIMNQDSLTFSEIDVNEILSVLDIPGITDAEIYGLQSNDSYVPYEWYGPGYFDGWRDAAGDYTTYYGGYNQYAKHNSYPAVYCIKLTETCDTVKYYFYDYWKEYNPEEPDTMSGSGIQAAKQRLSAPETLHKAPETHYNYVIVDWYDEENDTTYQFRRNYRCDVGSDYKASFVVKTSEKYVLINATMHFVSEEDYLNPPVATKKGDVNEDEKVDISDIVAVINQIAGTASYQNADVNADEKVDISDIVAVINIIAGD